MSEARGTETVKKELPPEKDVTGEAPRIGVFVCHCGTNISSTVEIDQVVESIKKEKGVAYVTNTIYACAQDSQDVIKQMIKDQNLNRVVIASCTPRTHEPLFQETIREAGLNKYLFDLADIREQCSWCHKGQNEVATKKAIKIVKMAVAKSRLQEPLKSETVGVTPAALVIGGGVAGMTSALALADQGFPVAYRREGPGARRPGEEPLPDASTAPMSRQFLAAKIAEVKAHPKITVHTGAEVKNTDGFVGNFETTLTDGRARSKHGAIVLATGGVEYQPTEYLDGAERATSSPSASWKRSSSARSSSRGPASATS